ncbi:hypothetical protein LS68_008965 [Helicobacter sp. MIT 05-5293]|uniref:hypothetical protein n=1 Tax=Helicobacter sp. MIT 05-5293 TaxID=1548149 RepID=UPI00051DC38F|nr:hypothetical protein [Helicobacter sp. MIT 05-5293]TLD79959.1 hypothetical protein LS68_008965 [Helicobacter sp. MIT 05-5293]
MKSKYLKQENQLYQISCKPRKIHCAKEFKYPSNKTIRDNLKKIMQDIKSGANINDLLSRQYEKDKYDLYWRNYKIHHLHIPENSISTRSKYRLFVYFALSEAYLLYVDESHDDELFKRNKILEIIESNGWTDRLLTTINISNDSVPNIPENMQDKIRKEGICIFQKIGHNIIMPMPSVYVNNELVSVECFLQDLREQNAKAKCIENETYHS